MTGLSHLVPANLPGNISNVRWTANIGVDKTGITISWKWAAAVYTSFANHAGLNIKPLNSSTQNPYPNSDKAGTPENYKSFVVRGAKTTGGTNYTGNYSGTSSPSCTPVSNQRSAVSAPLLITKSAGPGGDDNLPDLDVTAMPNPSNTYFNLVIKSKSANAVTVRVFDMVGQVIERHEKIASNSVQRLGHYWPAGVYFIEIRRDGRKKFVKVIKAN
jgi:hypothetical protein